MWRRTGGGGKVENVQEDFFLEEDKENVYYRRWTRKLREGESEDFEQGQRARLYKKNVNEERDRDQRQARGVFLQKY
jgi:hypothetical protein